MSDSPVLSVPCLPSFVSLSGGVRLSGLVCALSPFICLPSCVSLSGGVRLSSLVCALCPFICLPSCVSLSGGVRLSGLVCALSLFICLPEWWCPPSRYLVSTCLLLSPHMCACVGWCVRLFDVLSPLFVSRCLPTCVPVLDGASAFLRSCLPLSPMVSLQYAFVLDGVSAFPRSCLPLSSSNVSLRFLEWCARLSKSFLPWSPIVPHCSPFSPIVFLYVCLCWMVCPPSRSLISHILPLSPQMVCPLSRRLVSELSPTVPTCVPVLDGASAFPRSCLPLVSHCLRSCFPVLDGVSAFRGFVSLVSQLVFLLVFQLVSQLVFLLVSLCGGWSDFAFFQTMYC